MLKSVRVGVGIIAVAGVVSVGVFAYLYQYKGLKHYWQAQNYVQNNPAAGATLYGANDSVYAGLLAHAGKTGIWVWGRSGPRFFKTTSETEFLAVKGCAGQEPAEENVTDEQYPGLSAWGEDWLPGNYVIITVDGDYIVRAMAVDFWMFVDADLKTQCQWGKL